MKKILAFMLCMMLVITLFSAQATTDKLKFGVTLLFRTDDWWVDIERAMKKEAEELGIELIFTDAEGKTEKMIQHTENLISLGVDAVLGAPQDQVTSDAILDICRYANIPYFFFESSLKDYSGITAYTNCDAVGDGQNIARWIKEYVQKNLSDKETIKIAMIDFFPSEVCMTRSNSCIDELKVLIPNLELVAHQDGGAARAESMNVTENILTANKNDVDIFVSIAGWDSTSGVKAAIEASKADSVVVGCAWGEECCLVLEQGDPIVQAILLGLPTDMTKIVVAAYDYFTKGGLESPIIDYNYLMADHETIFDLDWRAIKGLN